MATRRGTGVLVVSGGGTGGHIFPALAVADVLRRRAPERDVVYLGRAGGMEEGLARERGLAFYGIPAAGLARRLSLKNVDALGKAVAGLWQARSILNRVNASAVLGTGGFVCGPVVMAAASLGLPSLIHESNAVPGLTNRLLAGFATRVAVNYSAAAERLPAGKTFVSGFPLRQELWGISREAGCAAFGLDPARRTLLVFPGSLAARRINRAMISGMPKLSQAVPELQVLWMTGSADYALVRRVVETFSLPVVIREFIQSVPEAYAAADLVLARAGAGTLAELSALGKPALLVPYPFATDRHQHANAREWVATGAAVMLEDQDLRGDALVGVLCGLLGRLSEIQALAQAAAEKTPRDAAEVLAGALLELAEGGHQA